jgi:hypothetical protein
MTGVAAAGIIARPVDIVSGQKFLSGDDELDFVLPSRLPVRWQRYWRSGNPGDSVLGRGWSLFWESRLEPYQDGLVWRAPSGDYVAFPNVPKGLRTYCESEKTGLNITLTTAGRCMTSAASAGTMRRLRMMPRRCSSASLNPAATISSSSGMRIIPCMP